MFFFNKIYTYEHFTPALWFRRGGESVQHPWLSARYSLKALRVFYNCVRRNGLVNKTLKGRQLLPCLNHRPGDEGVSRGSARAIKGNLKCLMPCFICIWLFPESARRLQVFDMCMSQCNTIMWPCAQLKLPLVLLVSWLDDATFEKGKKKRRNKKRLLGFVVFHNWAQTFPNSGVVV